MHGKFVGVTDFSELLISINDTVGGKRHWNSWIGVGEPGFQFWIFPYEVGNSQALLKA